MFDAVILAGGRTNSLLSRHSEEKYEAMIEIQNKPMVSYVAEALRQSSQIRRIYVAGPAKQLAGCPLPSSTKVVEGGASVIDTANLAFAALSQENITENKKVKEKILIATSDIPLLTAESIDDFLEKSLKTEADVYYPVISKKTYENLLPESRRTYVRLKEGLFTGGNIFLANPQVLSGCAKIAESIIAKRKNPFKLCGMLGWSFVVKFVLGRLELLEIEARVSRMLKIKGAVVVSDYPQLGFDVDKPEDLEVAQKKIKDLLQINK